jgi:hypothetical protein
MNFKESVAATPHLKNSFCEGLQALRAEDKPHVEVEDTRKLAGSVDVDTALQKAQPQANRWDFAIAYNHTNRSEEFVYWTELHTASDSQVKVVIKKAQWLVCWLKNEGHPLAGFERDILWVSSRATSFNLTGYQQKQMAAAGLRHVGSKLRIRNKR